MKNNVCIPKRKTCSEYLSAYSDLSIPLSCSSDFTIAGTDTRKTCFLYDGVCIEDYASCSVYSGADVIKDIYEGIKLDDYKKKMCLFIGT